MTIPHTPKAYVFNLQTTSSSEAKRLWRRDIKENWDYECAYCGDDNHLTICLLYTSPSPRDRQKSRMPSSA